MNKFSNKETIFITICVVFTFVQMNYFATKLEVANLKIEMLEIRAEMKTYSDIIYKEINDKNETKKIDNNITINDKLERTKTDLFKNSSQIPESEKTYLKSLERDMTSTDPKLKRIAVLRREQLFRKYGISKAPVTKKAPAKKVIKGTPPPGFELLLD